MTPRKNRPTAPKSDEEKRDRTPTDSPWFAYHMDEGIEWFKTAAEAKAKADELLELDREEARDGWPDGVSSICWGRCSETCERTVERPVEPDDACHDCDEYHDYELIPTKPTGGRMTSTQRAKLAEADRKQESHAFTAAMFVFDALTSEPKQDAAPSVPQSVADARNRTYTHAASGESQTGLPSWDDVKAERAASDAEVEKLTKERNSAWALQISLTKRAESAESRLSEAVRMCEELVGRWNHHATFADPPFSKGYRFCASELAAVVEKIRGEK